MKTIEIQQTNIKANKRLIKKIYSLIDSSVYIHFLYEPELIVRTENEGVKAIIAYLSKRKIKYKIYSYPFGKGYGEDKKSPVYKYRRHFIPLMQINSSLAIECDKKDRFNTIERIIHTLLNTFSYDWTTESIIHNNLFLRRVWLIRKYESRSLATSLLCTLIIFNAKIGLILTRLLK